jgi:DNA topoisomerase II
MADNIRSIPSIVDGLKPSQRKVIFGCFKRKMKSELKVSLENRDTLGLGADL